MEIQQAKEGCDAKIRKFNRLIRRYDPGPLEPEVIQDVKNDWSKELSTALDDLVDSVETMSIKHGKDLGSQEVAVWKKKITDGEGEFSNHMNKVGNKLKSVQSNATRPINVSMPGLAPQTPANQSQAVNNAMADVEVDAEIVATEGKELAAKVNKYMDWSEATNDEIELAMANIDGWEKKFAKIREKSFAIKRNTLKFNLDDMNLKRAEAVVGNLEAELELAIEDIISEDKNRCLFSLNKSKAADVKLPHFSGNKEEDFSKFKKEFEKGLKTNRVRKEDQIKKLREFLKGDAKTIIPDSMEDIDTAWDILKSMYGDASRVMEARKRKIKDMGAFPRSGKPQVMLKNQIEWITKLEVTLNDIKELAEESAQMERDAYSSDMMHLIMSYFPNMIQKELQVEMENLPDDGKIRLLKILDHIVKHRRIVQGLLKTAEATVDHAPAGDGANGGGRGEHGRGGQGGQVFRGSQTGNGNDSTSIKNKISMKGFISRMIPKSAVAFQPAQRDEKCRVCNALEGIGDTKDLYDNHTQSVAVGCPRFATMSMEKKREIVKKAQLCDYCLDQNAVVKPGTLHVKCPVSEKKRFYSCMEDGCKTHFWLCDSPTHIQKNKKKIENSERHWKNQGKTYIHHATVYKAELGGLMREGSIIPGPCSQGGLGEEGLKVVGTTTPSGPSPLRGSGAEKEPPDQETVDARVSLKDATEKLKKVEEVYDAFFKIWNVSMIPRLIPQPKWFKDSPELQPEEVVWFPKTENELSSDWTVGQVDTVTRSKDGVVRRAWVRYYNHTESNPRRTYRAVRSLVRLFNVEDNYFVSDMAAVEAMISDLETEKKVAPKKLIRDDAGNYKIVGDKKVDPLKVVRVSGDDYEVKKAEISRAACKSCCCAGHCALSEHNQSGVLSGVSMATKVTVVVKEEYGFPHIYERVLMDEPGYPEPMKSSLIADRKDEIFDMLTALETDLNLKVEKVDDNPLPGSQHLTS